MPYHDKNQNPYSGPRTHRLVDLYKLIRLRSKVHTKDDVIKAAKAFIVFGSMAAVARETGLKKDTVRTWSYKDWWSVLLEEIKYMKNSSLDGQYTRIVEKSLESVLDRLENGDEVVVGKELRRKKVSARDSALIAAVCFDKRQLLRGEATNISQTNFSVDERLTTLQEAFDKIAQKTGAAPLAEEITLIKEGTAPPGPVTH